MAEFGRNSESFAQRSFVTPSYHAIPKKARLKGLTLTCMIMRVDVGLGGSHDFFQARSIVPVMALEKPLKLQLYIETLT